MTPTMNLNVDNELVIIALEGLQEQVMDSIHNQDGDSIAEWNERLDQINEHINIFKLKRSNHTKNISGTWKVLFKNAEENFEDYVGWVDFKSLDDHTELNKYLNELINAESIIKSVFLERTLQINSNIRTM